MIVIVILYIHQCIDLWSNILVIVMSYVTMYRLFDHVYSHVCLDFVVCVCQWTKRWVPDDEDKHMHDDVRKWDDCTRYERTRVKSATVVLNFCVRAVTLSILDHLQIIEMIVLSLIIA
jgi:hypothetical protein